MNASEGARAQSLYRGLDGVTETVSGRHLCLLDPEPDAVVIEDIAHSLSCEARYNGGTRDFYSVAQHAPLVEVVATQISGEKDVDVRRAYLAHDNSEYVMKDVPRPLKQGMRVVMDRQRATLKALVAQEIRFCRENAIGPATFEERIAVVIDAIVESPYDVIERGVTQAINASLNIPDLTPEQQAVLHKADNIVCRAEAASLVQTGGSEWCWNDTPAWPLLIVPLLPRAAKSFFMHAWEKLK